MATSTIVSRFAPSPTGYLHVGGARTALFSWLLARHDGGRFLLRIEDTDLARSTEQATVQVLEDLRWLGLHWDNPQLVQQSKRLDVYNQIIDDLIARDLAYRAYETEEELAAMRKSAEKQKRAFVYRRRMVGDQPRDANTPHVVRFAMPVKEYRFGDVVLGKEIVLPAAEAQDFVIRKTDGMPTYHFAVVVDDAEMGVTHILRGQEHTKNTFNHIALQEALGYARPIYGHLPIIMNMDGSKMGKRDRDKKIRQQAQNWMKNTKSAAAQLAARAELNSSRIEAWIGDAQSQLDIDEQAAVMRVVELKASDLPEILVHDFRGNGYLPEVLLNFLALLGWSPGGDREHMSVDEMVQLFSIEGIGKSNAKFDRAKLLSFNTEALAAATPQRVLAGFRDYLSVHPESPLNTADDAALAKIITMKKGMRTLREADEAARFLFVADEQIQYDPEAIEKVLRKQNGAEILTKLRPLLEGVSEWTAQGIEHPIQQFCEQSGLGLGKAAQPIRVAVSGGTVSPPIFQSLEFLGQVKTLARIDRCLRLIG